MIQYCTQSSSDFDRLHDDVTKRSKAQVKKTEKLQAVAAMSQVEPTEGLSPHEIAALVAIVSEASTPNDGIHPYKLKELMKRSGYTGVAATLAMAGLKKKGLIEFTDVQVPESFEIETICSLSGTGIEWMLKNQDRFRLESPRNQTLSDEDIPF